MTDTNPLDQPAVFTERMRREHERNSDYLLWHATSSHLTYDTCMAEWSRLTTLHGLDEPATPAAPDPQRVRVFVGKSDDNHRRGTHRAWRFPAGRYWLGEKDFMESTYTLTECENHPNLRELRPDEFDLVPGEPGYVEPVKQAEPKPDDELARLRAEVDRLTMALSRSEKEAALLREHIQKRKPRAKKRKAVRRGK